MGDADREADLRAAVQAAHDARRPLRVHGGASKDFYGRAPTGEPLDVSGHRGVVSYEPTELVLRARAGTPLAEIDAVLGEAGQMLAFEPPRFGESATLGGAVACGLSGPRRPYAGAVRDFVLGVRCLNGRGEALAFGGQVMKNVAGYDVARAMVGALGTLGVLLEVSLKVLPAPARELTLAWEMDAAEALAQMNRWAGRPLPLSAACHDGDRLYARLSGTAQGVEEAHQRLGGEPVKSAARFWSDLREHRRAFFRQADPLWRLSLPPAAPMPELPGDWLLDWGGAQRWLRTDADAEAVRAAATAAGGHATCFRGGDRDAVFHPLAPALARLHERLKAAFDPAGILNPGRLYPQF